jgi:TatD DNase family protein
MFIDTHAHLLDERFNKDLEQVIASATTAKVSAILVVACSPDGWASAMELCKIKPSLRCSLGIHPDSLAGVAESDWENLETLGRRSCVSAIGETGLDYHYEGFSKENQLAAMRRHIAIAQQLDKPLILHCRDAYSDFIKELDTIKTLRGVVHCFSGSVDEAKHLTAKGLFLGIDGPVTYPKSETLRSVVQAVPLEKLLLETDCPYLPPQQFRGKRNEPAYVAHVATAVAQVKGVSIEEVAHLTTQNAQALFNLAVKNE